MRSGTCICFASTALGLLVEHGRIEAMLPGMSHERAFLWWGLRQAAREVCSHVIHVIYCLNCLASLLSSIL